MATFYVSYDTDYSQGVDAGQAKEQGEEPIHLGNTEHNWWVAVLHRIQPLSASLLPFLLCVIRFLYFLTNLLQMQAISSDASCGNWK